MNAILANPVLVNSLRGSVVENRHRGAVVACDVRGRTVFSLGDTDALIYPRSAIKALQVIPLIETGAAEHFSVTHAELALACASHNAEPTHVETVSGWLKRIGLDHTALACGVHPPLDQIAATAMLTAGESPLRLHNNCSGKHAGMLATACFLGEATQGYIEREHPTQQRWMSVVGELAGINMQKLPWSLDGCGIPVIAMPMYAMATALAHFATPDELQQQRAEAIEQIASAIASHPFMVAGSGRLCTELMTLTGQRVMVKVGADGVYAAALPGRGLGIAIKIDDGLREAAEVTLLATLHHLGALHANEYEALCARARMPIINTREVLTGHREAAVVWSMHAC